MNVNFPPESQLNQESGAKNILTNPTRTEKIDSGNSTGSKRHFSLKGILWPDPKIMFFNLHNDLLNRCTYTTLNILFINALFFFFYGKCYSSLPSHKTSREVSIRSRILILRTAVLFLNRKCC